MSHHLNVEIKARCAAPERIHRWLREQEAEYCGEDHQVDTYFHVPRGRFKLREGRIENHLIAYHRPDQAGPKTSEVSLYPTRPGDGLRELLVQVMPVQVVVDKKRHIYFIDHAKFHIDEVVDLGTFVEIEVIDYHGKIGQARLEEACAYYMDRLGIATRDLVNCSYSDLLLQQQS